MKVKKQHRKKKYLHKLNRKRMNKKQKKTGGIECKIVKEAWNDHKTAHRNLKDMGLVSDPNKAIKIPSFKEEQLKKAKQMVNPDQSEEEVVQAVRTPCRKDIAEKLEQEANAPRERKFMLPRGQVQFISHLLDTYGHDYKAMAKDKKNYYQETWKQLRAKIRTFMGIPKQYGEYLKQRGLLEKEDDDDELKKAAKAMVMDDD